MEKVFHMVGGEDEASYSKNSSHQRLVLKGVKPILTKCIEELLGDLNDISATNCLKVADLGCCSGPNTFLTMHHIIQSIDKAWKIRNYEHQEPPTIQYFLNDLVSNDFNLVFKGLPQFYQELTEQNGGRCDSCLVAAVPGSFYGKLFPDRSMHFLHSSYCLHWLSQVPSGLMVRDESGNLKVKNKGSIYCANTGPRDVQQAYLDQFTQDFTIFLKMRSQELVEHGHLLVTFICKDEAEVEGSHFLSLMGEALTEMVTQGRIEEEKLDSFNLPWYPPSIPEAKHIIEDEGSFKILRLHTFRTPLDASYAAGDDPVGRAMYVATFLRAIHEPVLASHFGEAIMDNLFHRYRNKLVKILQSRQCVTNTLVISLRKE